MEARAAGHESGTISRDHVPAGDVGQTRLPHARVTRDDDEAELAVCDLPPRLVERLDLRRTAHVRAQVGLHVHTRCRRDLVDHLVDLHLTIDALQGDGTHRHHEEPAPHEVERRLTDHEGARIGDLLEAGGEVRGLADDGVRVGSARRAHRGTDHEPGVDGDADPKVDAEAIPGLIGHRVECLKQVEAGSDGATGVVFVGDRVPEVHEDAVADVPRDVALVAPHHLVARALVAAQHLAHDFRIVVLAQRGRAHHVAEHDGELAALALARHGPVRIAEQLLGFGAVGRQCEGGRGEGAHAGPVEPSRVLGRVGEEVPNPLVIAPSHHPGD